MIKQLLGTNDTLGPVLVILGEFLGGIGVVTGTLTRVAAAGIAITMALSLVISGAGRFSVDRALTAR